MSSAPDTPSYFAARAKLIAEDRSLRRDHARVASASSTEREADEMIRAIRLEEASTIWSVEHEDVPNTFPGMEFLSGRDLVTKTKLFQILSKMPKGALLHAHLDAMVNHATLLKLALGQPAMHVRVHNALTTENLKSVLPEFHALAARDFSDVSSLTSSDYTPGTWVSIQRARESFDPKLGGPTGFDSWVLGSLTISPSEAYGTHNSVKKIWEKFTSTFIVATGLIRFTPVWSAYIREFFRSSIEDGISYIEARINFLDETGEESMVGPNGEAVSHREWVKIFDDAVKDVKAEMEAQGRSDEFIGARVIYSTIRCITPEDLEWYMEDCIQLKQEFPHVIAGFDIVGDENVLQPLLYYIEPLLRFKERVKELGLELPFILHAGETLGDGSEADNNLYDAILLGTKRIGHGFSLTKHPKLIEIVKEKNITIEVCPISNEILRLTSSMPAHPLPILINQGVPVALSSDDPAVFGNMGLSFDFFQVLVASEITGLITLGDIARQSIEASTLDVDKKAETLTSWERRWDQFVESIVDGSILSS